MSFKIINRRDFFKLKSTLLIWHVFHRFSSASLVSNDTSKTDYSLLDKLAKLPFSKVVKKEITFRIYLQKKYCTDANGKLISLERFVKEITNYIISKRDFDDFKLLVSINYNLIDYGNIFVLAAKHNNRKGLKYLQQKLISHKNDKILEEALLYAIKYKSFDTSIELMRQKIQLDKNTKAYLLDILQTKEYEIFYKKISGNDYMQLPMFTQTKVLKRRKMSKKTFSLFEYYNGEISSLYDYLGIIVHNSLVDLYQLNIIDDFSLHLSNKKTYITTYANSYTIDFISQFEQILYRNGFNSWSEDLLKLYHIEQEFGGKDIFKIVEILNKLITKTKIDIYDFLELYIE